MMTGEELRKLRERRGLTQGQLAKLADLSREQVNNLERGRCKIVPLRERQLREILAEAPQEPE
jgi:transcriptional regulator with XRE-family HTH domain